MKKKLDFRAGVFFTGREFRKLCFIHDWASEYAYEGRRKWILKEWLQMT